MNSSKMLVWIDVLVASASIIIFMVLVVAMVTCKRCKRRHRHEDKTRLPLFSWEHNPSLVTDAVENGWSRFSFIASCNVLPRSGDQQSKESEPEITWEVFQCSADFLQKIHFKSPSIKRKIESDVGDDEMEVGSMSASSVIRTALPLPGPSSAFPQEAYFEIAVLSTHNDHYEDDRSSMVSVDLGDRTQLTKESKTGIANLESVVKVEELKLATNKDNDDKVEGHVVLSLGLTTGSSVPLKLPGSYPGSIGFNSNGSLFLDGKKLVNKSEKSGWAAATRIIGCGFDPKQKKVMFTVDSELVHEVQCKAEEFGAPLHPTIAANSEITIRVNFGQCMFTYAPPNAHRTPNPCFVGPLLNSGFEDSEQLFSMERINPRWLHRNGTTNYGEESEADLFEIVLDRNCH